jgi:ribonuclease G
MVERVVRYKDKTPLMEAFGVEQEIRSTIGRRVDLPSGGYLIFDYAEAFTVIDVNTGRFVGGRGKNSGGRLEDTITKNNLEAVKEVVRQLRLRDIGGIIVIDFIDMANPKNRATVEEALRSELERDRTKTYVVEISPLGLVEMTRQNVTDGPREVMTRKCPTCGGDGIVYSEASAAIDVERRLRALAAGSRAQAFRVELADTIASALVGPGARRLVELEGLTKKRFFLEGKPETHLDHFVVLSEGKLAELAPPAPVGENAETMLQLVEVDRYDSAAAVGKLDGLDIVVADAASLVGKRVKVRVERVLDGRAYGVLMRKTKDVPEPLTAEGEAEKPTRKPPARKGATTAKEPEAAEAAAEPAAADEPEAEVAEAEVASEEITDDAAETPAPKKKTRRGSRGGRNRKKKPATAGATTEAEAEPKADGDDSSSEESAEPARAVTIHVPGDGFGREGEAEPAAEQQVQSEQQPEPESEAEVADESTTAEGEEAPKPKKKTRRGSRGGRNRKKKPATAATTNGNEPASAEAEQAPPEAEHTPPEAEYTPPEAEEPPEAAEPSANGDFEYVPMSEWGDEIEPGR